MPVDDSTWAGLVHQAHVEIGVRAANNDDLQEDEITDGFRRLRDMLDEWALEGLLVPGLKRLELRVTSLNQKLTYTIGPAPAEGDDDAVAPDIVSAKPIETITTVNYRPVGQQSSYPINATSYEVLSSIRTDYGFNPTDYYYEQSHPLAVLYLNAKPLSGDYFEIAGRGHLGDFESGDSISDLVPLGYKEAIKLNLAAKIAPSHGVEGSRLMTAERRARMSKSNLRDRNMERQESRLDPGIIGGQVNFQRGGMSRRNRFRW